MRCFKGCFGSLFLSNMITTIFSLGKACRASQVGHPYPEVPYLVEGIAYLVEGIAYRQAGSQQVGLGAGIQEEGFVEEAAYLEAYL